MVPELFESIDKVKDVNNISGPVKKRAYVKLMVNIQESCLKIYLNNLKIDTPKDYLEVVKTYDMLKACAVYRHNEKTEKNEIVEPLNELLKQLKQRIMIASSKFSKEEKEEMKKYYNLWQEEMVSYGHIYEIERQEDEDFLSFA